MDKRPSMYLVTSDRMSGDKSELAVIQSWTCLSIGTRIGLMHFNRDRYLCNTSMVTCCVRRLLAILRSGVKKFGIIGKMECLRENRKRYSDSLQTF